MHIGRSCSACNSNSAIGCFQIAYFAAVRKLEHQADTNACMPVKPARLNIRQHPDGNHYLSLVEFILAAVGSFGDLKNHIGALVPFNGDGAVEG